MVITIKSYSVKNGDMFYINHNNDTLTIIDCNLIDEKRDELLLELKKINDENKFNRFLSTHPDKDHITGIKSLDDTITIDNFYSVSNNIKSDNSEDFDKYCELRESDKFYPLSIKCERKWLNDGDKNRGNSGIIILWPDVNNSDYKEELEKVENSNKTPNNISPIIRYSLNSGITALWFGDMETEFLEKIIDSIELPETDILFAPHHGRDSGKIPKYILDKMKPKIIIIGEGKSDYLNYYEGFNTITQNSAKNIVLKCTTGQIDIYTDDEFNNDFLDYEKNRTVLSSGEQYRGTLNLN